MAAALGLLLAGGALDLPAPAPGTLRIYLVRHGQAYSNLDPRPNLPPEGLDRLTDLGHGQARVAGRELAGHGVSVILTSPAGRARETADEVRAAVGGVDLRVEQDLRPMDVGRSPSGKPLTFEDRTADWKAGRDPAPPGGESLEQVGRRVLGVATRLAGSGPRGAVVFVGHAEVIGAFLGLVRGKPGAQSYPSGLSNGSISVVDVPASGPPRLLLADHVPAPAPVR